jgi:hypothetical protein
LDQNHFLVKNQAVDAANPPSSKTHLQDFVLKNQGELTIFSNDVEVVIADNGIKYGIKNVIFSGTLVNVMLRCDEAKYCLDPEIRNLAGQSVF